MLPYRTTWLWGTFALHAASAILGANFADRPELAGQEEESCLWTPGTCEPLAEIEFQRQAGGASAPWHIEPAELRAQVIRTLHAMTGRYQTGPLTAPQVQRQALRR